MDIDYRKIIESRYNRQNWQLLLRDIFKSRVEFWATPYEISTNSPMAKQALWLGTITLSDDETIAIYEVELSDSVDIERNRRGIRDMLLTEWRNRDVRLKAYFDSHTSASRGTSLRMELIRRNQQIPSDTPIS